MKYLVLCLVYCASSLCVWENEPLKIDDVAAEAAFCGHYRQLKHVLKLGANPNKIFVIKEKNYKGPLLTAVAYYFDEKWEDEVSLEADTFIEVYTSDPKIKNFTKCINVLCYRDYPHPAALNGQDSDGNTALHILTSKKPGITENDTYEYKYSPLVAAMQTLLACNASLFIKNNDGQTPLDYAKFLQKNMQAEQKIKPTKRKELEIAFLEKIIVLYEKEMVRQSQPTENLLSFDE